VSPIRDHTAIPGLPEHIVAREVQPGTTYTDEPNQTVPAGWWVLGYDDPDEPYFQIHIGDVRDTDDNDIAEPVAKLIVAALEEAGLKGNGVL
jgi:hypothetical protein